MEPDPFLSLSLQLRTSVCCFDFGSPLDEGEFKAVNDDYYNMPPQTRWVSPRIDVALVAKIITATPPKGVPLEHFALRPNTTQQEDPPADG